MDKRTEKTRMMPKLAACLIGMIGFAVFQPLVAGPSHAQEQAVLTDKSPTGELAFWNLIKDANDVGQFRTYLENFPEGMFYDLALAKYQSLGGNLADVRAAADTKPAAVAPVAPAVKPQKVVSKKPYGKKLSGKKVSGKKIVKRVTTRRTLRPVCLSTQRLIRGTCRTAKKVRNARKGPVRGVQFGGAGGSSGNASGW